MEQTIQQKKVTYDFERMLEGATKVKTSEFASPHDPEHGAGGGDGRGVRLLSSSAAVIGAASSHLLHLSADCGPRFIFDSLLVERHFKIVRTHA